MTERTSWRCTGCGRVHAPHVDTCPERTLAEAMFPAGRPFAGIENDPNVVRYERAPAEIRTAPIPTGGSVLLSDHALDAFAGEHVAACGDHASPKPSPLRYRAMMGDIDA